MIPFVCAALLTVAGPPPPPRLVVLIVVDQLRPDYLDRYQSQWTGGFRRLLQQGAYFPNGRQDHAITETAPGHASLLSGRVPARTGIVANSRSTQDASAPVLGHPGSGASPRRFQGTTLFDWMRRSNPAAQVLGVSRKHWSAIPMVGRARGAVYWFSAPGFTTSTYYADSLPSWLKEFNARPGFGHPGGKQWELFAPAERYAEPDSMDFEHGGRDLVFPHPLPPITDSTAEEISRFPWMDSLTLDLALEGVTAMRLGQRDGADLVAISLSTTDAIGHDFGPESRELHDMLLRLDAWLLWFQDSLAAIVPADRTVFVLTSDHGVQSFPEFTSGIRHARSGRVWLGALADELAAGLRHRYLVDFEIDFGSGLLMADVAALRSRGVNVDSLARVLAAAARSRPGVARVFTPATLRAAPASDREARLWRRALSPGTGWLIAAVLEPGYTWQNSAGSTTHGSTSPLDVGVPIAFWGAGIKPGIHRRPVSVVDIGPTLAALVGVRPTEPVDGEVLPEIFPRRTPRPPPIPMDVERE